MLHLRDMWASADSSRDLSGSLLGGQFRLERRLDHRGMGDVYLAEQLELGRRVVIKMLAAAASTQAAQERFLREARALARLNHPNIVHVYAFGRAEHGALYFAMEYLPGHTLGTLLAESGAFSEQQTLSILEQLCAALSEAHDHGIIHRDLKPDNIMLASASTGEARIKVLDFGIAQLLDAPQVRITQRGELVGTPLYMAPEQVGGRALDERTDLYALGLIGFELLTARLPFEESTTADVLARAVRDDAPAPSRVARGPLSPLTDALILQCLRRDPEQRFQSARALQRAVRLAMTATTSAAHPLTASARASLDAAALRLSEPHETHGRRRSRRARLALGLAAGVLAGLAVAALALQTPSSSEQAPPSAPVGARPLRLKEWVQGIPFPEGTRYLTFEPTLIEARVAAETHAVLAFYRGELAGKWGGYAELTGGLLFADPQAIIETLTVVAADNGSRVVITRRASPENTHGPP